MTALPNWLSKLAAFALLFGLIGLTAVYGAMPLWQRHQNLDEQVLQAEELVGRLAGIRDKKSTLEARLVELDERQLKSGLFVAGETDAMAAVGLQERVKAAVSATDGQLKSTQTLPPQNIEGFDRIGVRVAMLGTIDSLFELLYDLEAGRPYLLVDNLDVKARRARSRKATTEVSAVQLTIRFDLYGFLGPEADS